MWQGVSTSYSDFEKYYLAHRNEIMQQLRIRPYAITDGDETRIVSDVEMLYGNPFDPGEIGHDFWSRYEDSLSLIDDQRVNLYFGKEKEGLKCIALLAENSKKILQEAFSSWINNKHIETIDSGYHFPGNCYIINFNYTNTVKSRFGVTEDNEFHIHGEADDKESIIVGHSSHPEYALSQLAELGGRFEGLFFIENALYESDKHVDDNYHEMLMDLAMSGVNLENIKDVYVLGHSFGEADYGYFRHLAHAMNKIDEDPFEGFPDWTLEYLAKCDDMGFLNLNILYAIHHRERLGKERDIEELPGLNALKCMDQFMESIAEDPYYSLAATQQRILEKAAVRARFLMEQSVRDAQREFEFWQFMSGYIEDAPKVTMKDYKRLMKQLKKIGWKDCQEMIQGVLDDRSKASADKVDAKVTPPLWHISYYSDADKERIESVMKRVQNSSYELYSSIDECIEKFSKRII